MRERLFDTILHYIQGLLTRFIFFLIHTERQKRRRLSRLGKEKQGAQTIPTACTSVIIPVLDEAKHIANVVAYALSDPATGEVIVIDDGSIDDTANLARQAGAKVFTSSMLGKGASMRDGVEKAEKEIIVYLDGDLSGLRPNIISDLCKPILHDDVDLVKASFGRSSGRVTELTAKPMIKIFFPELAEFTQPLGGIIAAQKSLLQQLNFEDGYGVDIGILLDTFRKGGTITQVKIGSIKHESQSLHDLTAMANEVSRVIFQRAKELGRLHAEQVAAMAETQRQAAANLSYILSRRKDQQKLLLLDMDGTILSSRYIVELAKACGKLGELLEALHQNDMDSREQHDYDSSFKRTDKIIKILRFVHKRVFEQVARSIKIREDVIDFIKEMKRQGFMVGLITDSYFIAAEIVRRRIFADFALAHTVTFDNDVCIGDVQINSAFISKTENETIVSKKNVLHCVMEETSHFPFTETWAVGDNLNDLSLLKAVDCAFVIEPKSPILKAEPSIRCLSSFKELLEEVKKKPASSTGNFS